MSELSERRERFFNKMKENSAALVFSGVSKISSEDEFFPFCVNKNFYYLTNIEQENSVLLLVKGIGIKRTYLFVDEYNELKEKWTGKRLTFEQAKEISDVGSIYSTNNLENMINLTFAKEENQYGNIQTLYLDLSPEIKIKDNCSTQIYKDEFLKSFPHIEVLDYYPILTELRMVKSSYEIEQIVHAINATSNGINNLIKTMRPGNFEYEVADNFEFYGRSHDRHALSFSTIVAGGKNATCLHYPTQREPLNENDLVLFDLGYRNNQYCADISRTYPLNGTYIGKQRDIYEAVLNCNKAVIAYIREGLTLAELQNYTIEFLKNECIRLKLMSPDDDIKKYYFHNISHHLGLDTHDIADRKKPLENGNVITVEPGLYFSNYGIGVRIEDDVAIINGKAEVLSKNIKKEIDEIERLFKSRGAF